VWGLKTNSVPSHKLFMSDHSPKSIANSPSSTTTHVFDPDADNLEQRTLINDNNSISLIPTDAIQCNGVRYKYLSLSFSSVSEFSLSVNSYNIGHERTLCKIPYLTIPQNIPAFNQICHQTPQESPSSAPVLQALLSPLSSPTPRSPTHSTTCAPLRLLPL